MWKLVALAAALVVLGVFSSQADAAAAWDSLMSPYDAIYKRIGAQLGVDWRLVKAIAQHESGEKPDAVDENDNESIGLMQVYCRPDGNGGCANRLNVDGWPRITRAALFDPSTNVYIGAQILAANIAAYGLEKGIAVYNAWDQHSAPAAGPFKNQAYVDDVLRRAAALGFPS